MFHDSDRSSQELANELPLLDEPAALSGLTQFSGPSHDLQAGFELPSSVWLGMLACYGIFFMAIFAATGGSGHAIFAIVVSVLYSAMYFGLARILSGVGGQEKKSPLSLGRGLQTWTGIMNRKAVFGQVLIVPISVAFFGVAIAIICMVILP